MRCSSCGTQNEPDSRFCGGCGARLSAGENRIAPTQKIQTGANEAQPNAQQVAPPAPVIPHTPPAGPLTPIPGGQAHASAPLAPRGSSAQQSAQAGPPRTLSSPGAGAYAAPPAQSAPQSMPQPVPRASGQRSIPGTNMSARPAPALDRPPPRQRWGLIIAVLLVDLALAATGAWMLSEGVAAGDAAEPAKREPPAASGSGAVKTGEAVPKPAAPATPGEGGAAAGSLAGNAAAPGAGSAAGATATAEKGDAKPGDAKPGDAKPGDAKPGDAKPGTSAQSRKKKLVKKPPPGGSGVGPKGDPIDPYPDPDRDPDEDFGPAPGPPPPAPPPPPRR